MTTIEAMKQAMDWVSSHPDMREISAGKMESILCEAIAAEESQGVEPVAAVLNGHYQQRKDLEEGVVHELFTRPAPPPADHIGDATKLAGERAALARRLRVLADAARLLGAGCAPRLTCEDIDAIADMLASDAQQLSNDDAYMLRRKWFGHRNTGNLSFVEAVDATMEGLMAQQVDAPLKN